MSDMEQPDGARYDNRPAETTPEEVQTPREILERTFPGFVLEVLSTAPRLGEVLTERGLERGLVVNADADELRGQLGSQVGDAFEVMKLGDLVDPFGGYALIVPADTQVLLPILRNIDYSEFFLMTYVPEEYWENVVGPRDHAPSIVDLQTHFGHFAASNVQAPVTTHRDADLVLAAMRHETWDGDRPSASFIYSRKTHQVIGRS